MLPQKKVPQRAEQQNKPDVEFSQKQLKRAVRGQLIMAVSALLLIAALIFPMSVAWFTNVARTGSLQFQTESWGFDAEKITVNDTVAVMQPGNTGYVSLSVDNGQGVGAIYATVHVDKRELSPEMQQRLYFYVDAPKTYTFGIEEQTEEAEEAGTVAAQETVSRQYLASSDPYGYRYYIRGGECLTLSESFYNDVPLEWVWVNDMEGYYFLGRVTDEADGEDAVEVEEYLRPIQYDLDEANFCMDADDANYGQLVSIGETTVAEFLEGIFASDGYEGTLPITNEGEIDSSAYVEVNGRRYYRVAVDETDWGVWAYLCNETDTQEAAYYDNNSLGAGTLTVKIMVTVTNATEESDAVQVSNAQELMAQLTEANGQMLQLTEDITLDTPVALTAEETEMRIDLNSYNLLYSGEEEEYAVFTVSEGAKLTLLNGGLHGAEGDDASTTKSSAVLCKGGEVVLGAVKVDGFDTAVKVDDRSVDADSTVKITDCSFDTAATAVLIYGNGLETVARSRVIIQNSTIKSDYIGISGQGTNNEGDQRWGTELVVLDSTVEGQWAGIYQPQQKSVATISGSSITGYTALVVKGGTVTLYGTTVNGTGAYASAKASDGFTDTGGGIYVEATYPWSATVVLRGTENEVYSEQGYALELFGASGKGQGTLRAEGGTFLGEKGASNRNGIGTFEVPTETESELQENSALAE